MISRRPAGQSGSLSLLVLLLLSAPGLAGFMPSSGRCGRAAAASAVVSFLESIKGASRAQPGGLCLLDAQCSWAGDVICSRQGRCECVVGAWDGAQCVLMDDPEPAEAGEQGSGEEPDAPQCTSLELKKNGKCYTRKKPGETCDFSEQCMNIGDVQYYCIANICQEAPGECGGRPGRVQSAPRATWPWAPSACPTR